MRVILSKIDENDGDWYRKGCRMDGYTRVTTTANDGIRLIFYAHPFFQGRRWYDWVYVHFEEINATGQMGENFYPAKILGFRTINNITEAVIQCSEKPLIWADLLDKFFVKTTIGTNVDESYVTVPISALLHPLCVFLDYGGNRNSYVIILRKRNWSRYFGDRIRPEYEKTSQRILYCG